METSREYEITYLSGDIASNTIYSGRCTLGYLTVGSTTAGTITVSNASTTIALLQASVTPGTYTFNAVISDSLVITLGGSSTVSVMYRV